MYNAENTFYANRLLIGVLMGVILIVVGGTYYLKHLDNEKALEKERNLRLDYEQWHLPEGAKARIGSGRLYIQCSILPMAIR